MVLHFKGQSYDFFKYQGRTRVNNDSLLKRKDKWFFEKWSMKLAHEEEAIGFLAANFIAGNKYVRDLDYSVYTKWLGYRDALYYRFQSDLEKYAGSSREVDPLKDCFAGSVDSFNYLVLANYASDGFLFDTWNKVYGDNIIFEDLHKKLLTYSPFVIQYWGIDDEKKAALRNFITDKTKRVKSASV